MHRRSRAGLVFSLFCAVTSVACTDEKPALAGNGVATGSVQTPASVPTPKQQALASEADRRDRQQKAEIIAKDYADTHSGQPAIKASAIAGSTDLVVERRTCTKAWVDAFRHEYQSMLYTYGFKRVVCGANDHTAASADVPNDPDAD